MAVSLAVISSPWGEQQCDVDAGVRQFPLATVCSPFDHEFRVEWEHVGKRHDARAMHLTQEQGLPFRGASGAIVGGWVPAEQVLSKSARVWTPVAVPEPMFN